MQLTQMGHRDHRHACQAIFKMLKFHSIYMYVTQSYQLTKVLTVQLAGTTATTAVFNLYNL